ncbi:MAG: DUF4364 family protein [Oscillospiraceae bacterium]|nr:DUF4364 family protein [Oscillospiraceae bacterium]
MDQLGFIYEALDLKILILYILRRMPWEIRTERLLSLCQTDGAVSYFDFSVCLAELQESGQVEVEDDYCRITARGERNVLQVEDSLPYSVRIHAARAAEAEAERMQSDLRVALRTGESDGKSRLQITLTDKDGELLSLSFRCRDAEEAARAGKLLRRNADSLWQEIRRLAGME